jgi:dTDP-4-amino-4,6-dideoxygalactose transaminase
VHLYGQVADMDPILAIAAKHKLPVIEDACQAHGAEYKGRSAGSMGVAGAFSFYPGKNLGAIGEAGGTVTNDSALAAKIQTLRDHGQKSKYHHSLIGWNARMDGIQGAALRLKLRVLADGNAARRAHAARYSEKLAGTPGIFVPFVASYGVPVFHLYVVRVANRDNVLAELGKRGISCGIHYPKPVHLQEAYASLGYTRGALPTTERCADEVLSLPMFPEMTAAQIDEVVIELKMAVSRRELGSGISEVSAAVTRT